MKSKWWLLTEGIKFIGSGLGAFSTYKITSDGAASAVIGTVVGSRIEETFNLISEEMQKRQLAPFEERKVVTTATFAVIRIQDLLDDGKEMRKDDFFEDYQGNRNASEEVFEHTLIIAKKEYDEMKLMFLGYLFAGILFDSTISKDEANKLLELGGTLSYRQIKLISLFSQNHKKDEIGMDIFSFLNDKSILEGLEAINIPIDQMKENMPTYVKIPDKDYKEVGIDGYAQISLLQDIFDLIRLGILTIPGQIILDVTHINPSKVTPIGLGAQLYNLMDLKQISREDKEEIVEIL